MHPTPARNAPRPVAGRLTACAATLLLCLPAGAAAPDSGARITPNFKDADIAQIIEAVSAATGKNFIIDPRVKAQVTMLSTTPMSPDQFYQAFLAILQVHGFAAIPAGNVIKILPEQGGNPRQMPGNDLPERVSRTSDEYVTQIIALRNANAAQLVPVLRPLMPQSANLAAINSANMLIITDRAGNVNRMMRIVGRIDQSGSSDIDVVPLQSATAADTVRVLSALIASQGAEGGGTPVRIVADDRSNSILVSGDQAQRLRIKALIAHLDTPLDSGSETQVRYLRYADAEDLASRLKGQLSGSGTGGTSTRGPAQPAAAGAAAAAGPATLSLEGGSATIWADKDTNALVITAGQRTMRALGAVIDKLDIRRMQVLVQAIIVEVSADKSAELGINWVVDGSNKNLAAGGFIEPIGGTSIVDLYTAAKSGTIPAGGEPLGTTLGIGRLSATGINFAAMIRALQGDSRTNIIATPSIQTQDNQEAKIEVAQEVPFITGQYTGSTGTTSAFQTIQRQAVGTLLTVTPQINQGDAVLLKIQVESSSIAKTAVAASDIITNKRTINTNVLIKDGGTLVLGGLISDSTTNAEQRVPLLGRIPLIGELFRTRSTERKKSNLMVFIQPRILRDDAQAALETNAKYNFMRDQQQRNNRETTVLPLLPFEKPSMMPPLVQPPADATTAPATTAPEATAPARSAPAPADSARPQDTAP
ncbi:MAG: type II secretion system secretin GspD [Gammaproteobacteria bacterium]|nr:type II secretion system secretin GspD [Gammaproteobacteria bacterium]